MSLTLCKTHKKFLLVIIKMLPIFGRTSFSTELASNRCPTKVGRIVFISVILFLNEHTSHKNSVFIWISDGRTKVRLPTINFTLWFSIFNLKLMKVIAFIFCSHSCEVCGASKDKENN
jgi:hypothetical protein